MSSNIDRRILKAIARNTLGRTAFDGRPISAVYTVHLRHFLDDHPDEQDSFTIDLDNGAGAVFCRVCEYTLPAGSGEPEEDGKDIFGSMDNFKQHVKTPLHIHNKSYISHSGAHIPAALSSNTVRPPSGRSASSQAYFDLTDSPPRHTQSNFPSNSRSNSRAQHVVDLSDSPRHFPNSNAIASSSHGTPSQDMDPDFLLALRLNEELNGPQGHMEFESPQRHSAQEQRRYGAETGAPSWGSGNVTSPELASSIPQVHGGVGRHIATSSTPRFDELEEQFPFEETYHAQIQSIIMSIPGERVQSYSLYRENSRTIQARCVICHFSVALPGSGSFEASIGGISECMGAYEEHLKSPLHIRRKNDAQLRGSGQIPEPIQANRAIIQQPQPHALNPPSHLDTGLGKRKFPGAWSDDDMEQSVQPNPLIRLENDPYVHGMPREGSSFAARAEPWPPTRFPNRPVVPLPEMSQYPDRAGPSRNPVQDLATLRYSNFNVAAVTDHGDADVGYDRGGQAIRGVIAGPDLEKQFKDFMHKALEEFKDVTSVTDAQKKLNMQTENDLLDGMHVCLLPHQIIGVAWMVDQENTEDKCGGILADAMGLGKTVQMIATMVYNRPPQRAIEFDFFERHRSRNGKDRESEYARRTTLVLAPASLLQQWYEEFEDKTRAGFFRVHIHHGKDKLKSVKEIEEYDVVIASHQSVVTDFPKKKKKSRGDADEDDSSDADVPVTQRKSVGPLAKVRWLRVVIDEAQSIRNRSTRLSVCVAKLDSRHRWCLTGTPVTNSLVDLYGFLRFCRFSPWDDWKTFNNNVAKVQRKNPTRAGQKAQTILRPHLLRRTKDSTLDGKPIIRLGEKTIEMIELDFTPEEREIYKSAETSQKKIVSRFFREGTVMKNYSYILVMILRLRQLCCHPSLATAEAESEEINPDMQKNELERAEKLMGPHKVKEIQQRFKARIVAQRTAKLDQSEPEEDDCAICLEPFVDNRRITSCTHEFCSDCISEIIRKAEGGEGPEEAARCPLCRATLSRAHIFVAKIFEPSPEELGTLGGSSPMPNDENLEQPLKKLKLEEAPKDIDTDFELPIKEDIEPSTKMRCMLDNIAKWRAENPEDKCIVYSQWTSMLDLVETYLNRAGIHVLRYDGKMNRLARVEAISQFKKPSGPSVMLISLKCGGVGLNLTVANRVINLDLAWNFATEAQAYDRVHRLGQNKKVTVQRLVISGTIEERILQLQEKKKSLSDAALGEGTVGKLQGMTARDIAQLFEIRV